MNTGIVSQTTCQVFFGFDVPGTLQHAIVRGIERRGIVNEVADRKNFVVGSWSRHAK